MIILIVRYVKVKMRCYTLCNPAFVEVLENYLNFSFLKRVFGDPVLTLYGEGGYEYVYLLMRDKQILRHVPVKVGWLIQNNNEVN